MRSDRRFFEELMSLIELATRSRPKPSPAALRRLSLRLLNQLLAPRGNIIKIRLLVLREHRLRLVTSQFLHFRIKKVERHVRVAAVGVKGLHVVFLAHHKLKFRVLSHLRTQVHPLLHGMALLVCSLLLGEVAVEELLPVSGPHLGLLLFCDRFQAVALRPSRAREDET